MVPRMFLRWTGSGRVSPCPQTCLIRNLILRRFNLTFMSSTDPFQSWRHPTGRTGARGDYTDDQCQRHKGHSDHYAKHHRKPTQAAVAAAYHPGADATAYVNEKNKEIERQWNTNPEEVSWSGAKLACSVQPYEGDQIKRDQEAYQQLTDRRLQGTWDRSERIPVRSNRTAMIRETLRFLPVEVKEVQPLVRRQASTKLLKKTPGLPFYTPREAEFLTRTNNSAQLRRHHGKRERAIHNHYSGKMVPKAKHGVRTLDIRRWIDHPEAMTNPKQYDQYARQRKPQWCNT